MTTTRRPGIRHGMVPVVMLALLAAGCGTRHAAGTVEANGSPQATPTTSATSSTPATPSIPADFPCPGETSTPTPTPTAHVKVTSGDHYTENHGFRTPFALHGQRRCDGLAAVAHVKSALEPLRKRGDFAPEHTRSALTGPGYPAQQVRSYRLGPDGVGFRIEADTSPIMCVTGTMGTKSVQAKAFGGYPDHPGCETPSGGH